MTDPLMMMPDDRDVSLFTDKGLRQKEVKVSFLAVF